MAASCSVDQSQMESLEDSFDFRTLNEDDFDEAWSIFQDEYNTREPLSLMIQFSPEEAHIAWESFMKDALSQHVSMGAVDKKTKKLIGIRMTLLGKLRKKPSRKPDLPLKVKQMFATVNYFLGDDTSKMLGTKDYCQYIFLAVRKDYSGLGIATELYKRSNEIAKAEGCKKIFTLASSEYTQKIAAKFGFEWKKHFLYSDYVDPITDEKIYESMPEPHKSCALVIKDL